jgi:hypothetical protein
MHLILFLIAIVLAFAGVVLLLYSVPVIDVAAAALFTSGIMAMVGGFVLAGLAAAVRSLGRIVERLEIQPLPVPPVAAMGREDPAPRPVRTVQAPPTAPTPKRGSLLSWFGGRKIENAPKNTAAVTTTPAPAAASQPGAASSTAPAETDVDLGPLARAPEEPRVAPMPPPPPPPKPQMAALRAAVRPVPPVAAPAPVAAPPTAAVLPAATDEPESAVYKSGIIDGMAYRLFMDGSIEAELPQGKVRFATIDELQKYLTNRPQ